ncbi:phosphotransferase [Lentzea sp. NPDC102401]|uniref:phosphotransferase n=1 Tax=Lentzea sp. NPDC102401 TaxID=3364128 RepID=UPI00380DE92A
MTELLQDYAVSTVRSHNTPSALWHFRIENQSYVLKMESGSAVTMRNEIAWYRKASAIGFPRRLYVADCLGKAFSFIVLHYFGDSSTLDDAAIARQPASALQEHLRRALRMEGALFQRSQNIAPPFAIDNFLAQRFSQRYEQGLQYGYLHDLLTSPVLTINDVPMTGMQECWQLIKESERLRSHLRPRKVGVIFGDLHFGNILPDGSSTEVVDPRGGPLLPMEYDYGKLIQSIEGAYGMVMTGRYQLRQVTSCEYEFTVATLPTYSSIAEQFIGYLGDPMYLRSLYQAAMHFAAMLPHHASARQETIALALSGTTLFNRLLTLI